MNDKPMLINVGQFYLATVHMSARETGIFARLLMVAWENSGNLPDDEKALACIAQLSFEEWRALAQTTIWWPHADARTTITEALASCVVTKREPVTQSLRQEIFERDEGRCAYCGNADGPFHVDHIFPFRRGGRTERENLTLACVDCNLSKGAKTLSEWQQ